MTLCNDTTRFSFTHGDGNSLYKVFAKLSGTGNGAQQNVAHGLATTPNVVIPVANSTGCTELSETAAADGTNVYITATNAKDYSVYVWCWR